jgi:hypothetical protein
LLFFFQNNNNMELELCCAQVCRAYPIGAGSPSRGALLIQGADSPPSTSNLTTQFFLLSKKGQEGASSTNHRSVDGQIHLACSPEHGFHSELTNNFEFEKGRGEEEDAVVVDTFVATSEHGFSFSQGASVDPGAKVWNCKTPYARASISL